MRRLAALLILIGSGAAAAQTAQPTPKAVLANVQELYANATHLTALFRQVTTDATFGRTTTTS